MIHTEILAAYFIAPIHTSRKVVIKTANVRHPDTKDWTFSFHNGALLCTEPNGAQHLIPQSNVAHLDVKITEKPAATKPVKKSGSKRS